MQLLETEGNTTTPQFLRVQHSEYWKQPKQCMSKPWERNAAGGRAATGRVSGPDFRQSGEQLPFGGQEGRTSGDPPAGQATSPSEEGEIGKAAAEREEGRQRETPGGEQENQVFVKRAELSSFSPISAENKGIMEAAEVGGASEEDAPIREEQVQNAAQFLVHPKVQNSSMEERRKFLLKKGLTNIGQSLRLQRGSPPENLCKRFIRNYFSLFGRHKYMLMCPARVLKRECARSGDFDNLIARALTTCMADEACDCIDQTAGFHYLHLLGFIQQIVFCTESAYRNGNRLDP